MSINSDQSLSRICLIFLVQVFWLVEISLIAQSMIILEEQLGSKTSKSWSQLLHKSESNNVYFTLIQPLHSGNHSFMPYFGIQILYLIKVLAAVSLISLSCYFMCINSFSCQYHIYIYGIRYMLIFWHYFVQQ